MHLDEGGLQALLDRELPVDEERTARAHLAACASCHELLREMEGRAATVTRALAVLDVPPPLLPAREAVRRRGESGRRGDTAPAPAQVDRSRAPWLRAAAVVFLLVGAGASALPGSPLREWVAREILGAGDSSSGVASVLSGDTDSVAADVGVFVAPSAGQVRVELLGLPAGAVVRVEIVEREEAAVFAAGGTRFESGPGRLQASVEGNEVRVELPAGAPSALLRVNGERVLSRSSGRLELSGAGGEVSGNSIVIRVPAGGTPPASHP